MKVSHVVFLKLKEMSSEEEKNIKQQILKLKDLISGIVSVSFGKNISPERSKGFISFQFYLHF